MRFGIVELNCAYASWRYANRTMLVSRNTEASRQWLLTDVIKPASQLIIASRIREGCLGNELVCLIIQIEGEVVAQKEIEKGRLKIVVLAQGSDSLSSKEMSV